MALLATVIIWLHDFNNQGVLNMTPSEREYLAKHSAVAILGASINDDTQDDDEPVNDGAGQAREVRNKYLNRIGVVEGANSSDTEPLLQ